jgi:hypothetical protein
MEIQFWVHFSCFDFYLQDVLSDLTWQSSQKIEVSAGGKAFIRLSL